MIAGCFEHHHDVAISNGQAEPMIGVKYKRIIVVTRLESYVQDTDELNSNSKMWDLILNMHYGSYRTWTKRIIIVIVMTIVVVIVLVIIIAITIVLTVVIIITFIVLFVVILVIFYVIGNRRSNTLYDCFLSVADQGIFHTPDFFALTRHISYRDHV